MLHLFKGYFLTLAVITFSSTELVHKLLITRDVRELTALGKHDNWRLERKKSMLKEDISPCNYHCITWPNFHFFLLLSVGRDQGEEKVAGICEPNNPAVVVLHDKSLKVYHLQCKKAVNLSCRSCLLVLWTFTAKWIIAAACWGSSSAQATDGERVAELGSQGLPQVSSLEQCLKDAYKKLLLSFTLLYHSSKDSIYFLLGDKIVQGMI